ncbi:MAG: chromosome segregation protein SMC [Candidatus Poribacteria bacterium]|nr:chromosome segregation protein SMC [Candidatus Poribacteria bacterium]MDP6961659.1 chromosome segregation protein SMC [Dehalococcoidia bacterium]
MHLNRIRIQGFKSFADSTELFLEPGITTVVGPNGCGKSNVSDAIRWVLGEQRARSLRCPNMMSVLFNGGSNLEPAKKAEVSLRFANTEGSLSLESPEVEISRQLTKEGESHYFINQTLCRLKDVVELFMDTGVGVSAYSVMEQSKIDLILNTHPEERRFLFDEVAGITKYKQRKREALKKLGETESNIVRINDVIHELQRETAELKGQASQAEHYQQLQDQLRQLELDLSCREYSQFIKELNETQENLDQILAASAEANQTIQETEQQIDAAEVRQAELDQEIKRESIVVRDFESQIEKTERQIALFKERQLNIQQQRQRAAQAVESLQKQLQDLEEQRKSHLQEQTEIDVTLKLEESKLTARKRVLSELVKRIQETEQSVSQAQTDLYTATNQIAQTESQLASLNSKLEYSAEHLNRIQEQTQTLAETLTVAQTAATESNRQTQKAKADLLQVDTEKERVIQQLETLQNSLRKLESEISGIQDSLGVSASRLKSLKDLQSTYEGFYTGVRAILKAKSVDPGQFGGICGVLAELIVTDPDYEMAIEVALGSAIQNIVTETAEDAQSAINFLKRTRAGRVTFLPLDILRPRYFDDDSLLHRPGIIGVASELVGCDPKYEVAIDQLLGNTLVVEDLDTAINLTRRYRPSARLVTLEGEVLNTSGAVTGGHNSRQSSGLLSRSRELEELQEQIDHLSKRIGQKDTKRNRVVTEITDLQQQRQALTSQWQDLQIAHRGHLKDLEQAQTRVDEISSQLAKVESEGQGLHTQTTEIEVTRDELQAQLEEAGKTRNLLHRRITRMTEQIQSERSKKQEVDQASQELEIALVGKREKLQGILGALARLDQSRTQIEESIADHQKIIDSDEASKQEISEQIEVTQRAFLQLEQDKFTVAEKVEQLETERTELLATATKAQKLHRQMRRQYEKQNQMRHQLEVTHTQLQMQIKAISANIQDKYQVSIEEANMQVYIREPEDAREPEDTLASSDSDQAEDNGQPVKHISRFELVTHIEEIKNQVNEMGVVNMKAIEAYQEHKEREDFLVSQREDLQKSLDSTYKAIQKINQTSREAFLDTFGQIQHNFQEVFAELFDGGETELRLTEEEDILEAGVDIIACPPGKRPQTIAQLSGGERSLVAVALLFAIFKIKPTPFCVMDEVDAALDESNVLRFTNLVKKYAEQTQFIIITHNKRTMETADVMYGVTMEQAGISKLVSAKLSDYT